MTNHSYGCDNLHFKEFLMKTKNMIELTMAHIMCWNNEKIGMENQFSNKKDGQNIFLDNEGAIQCSITRQNLIIIFKIAILAKFV